MLVCLRLVCLRLVCLMVMAVGVQSGHEPVDTFMGYYYYNYY